MHSSVRHRSGQQGKRFLRLVPLILFLSFLNWGCAKDQSKKAEPRGPEFTHQEVIAGVNLLAAIVDWPEETESLQQKYGLDGTLAKSLLMPAHPLWDQKLADFSAQFKLRKSVDVRELRSCHLRCECHFYMQVLERSPELMGSFPTQFPSASKVKKLACARDQGISEELLNFLREEVKKFQADSVI